ncbi:MAG: hypothetical protein M1834_008202 [Cirrosporium novae-zelandiae]|nr:MAG: hypothetical protein M1834_008202 [Cirrosporium novae-zelandiae]
MAETTYNVYGVISAIWGMLLEVALFWQSRLFAWWFGKKPRDQLLDELGSAHTYEEWEEIAYRLDELTNGDLWRQNATSKYYDYRLIRERLEAIIGARDDEDILSLVSLLRSGLVRNLGNITSPRLFNRAYAGTKLLIEDYITQVALAIEYVAGLSATPPLEGGFSSQAKLDLLHDTRQAFGRSTLVLQGGAIFGLCHLGVVKALHLRGLLPRIITGTATGALIAALVCIHTEDELLRFLNGGGIDLTAFDRRSKTRRAKKQNSIVPEVKNGGWYQTSLRRIRRFVKEGYFLDVNVLEECVRANVGDLTFEEAYARTKRILNITVATSGRGGVPNLLNYLTAPNILIWSAALASNASSGTLYSPVTLQCKDETGAVVPWAASHEITFHSWRHANYHERESPLSRIAELFNVNHFIVSQARPYVAPFLRSDFQHPDPRHSSRWNIPLPLLRTLTLEVHHRLRQLDYLGLLPVSLRRLLIDEEIPGASLTLIPDLRARDFLKLLENPTKESLDHWILRGERSVWPAISALKVRCAVEVELDRGYQIVRRRKPNALTAGSSPNRQRPSNSDLHKRRRAVSLGMS